MGFGGLMWLFWILLAVVVVWLVRSVASDTSRNRTKTALEILEERYALGEIDSEEFERKKRDLTGS